MDAMTVNGMSRRRVYKRRREGGVLGNHSDHNIKKPTAKRANQYHEAKKPLQKSSTRPNLKRKMTWTPKWSEAEKASLENLRKRIRMRKAQLDSLLLLYPDVSGKWDWPSEAIEIVRDARTDATNNKELLTKDLNEILEWPTPALPGEDYFYNAEGPNGMFDRNKDWFEEEGFNAHETTYTFSDTWDKAEIKATILVPKNLSTRHKAPVMWFFHGGGFVNLPSQMITDVC
jgi:hypothetical protein